jgi:hypothetical protein
MSKHYAKLCRSSISRENVSLNPYTAGIYYNAKSLTVVVVTKLLVEKHHDFWWLTCIDQFPVLVNNMLLQSTLERDL